MASVGRSCNAPAQSRAGRRMLSLPQTVTGNTRQSITKRQTEKNEGNRQSRKSASCSEDAADARRWQAKLFLGAECAHLSIRLDFQGFVRISQPDKSAATCPIPPPYPTPTQVVSRVFSRASCALSTSADMSSGLGRLVLIYMTCAEYRTFDCGVHLQCGTSI